VPVRLQGAGISIADGGLRKAPMIELRNGKTDQSAYADILGLVPALGAYSRVSIGKANLRRELLRREQEEALRVDLADIMGGDWSFDDDGLDLPSNWSAATNTLPKVDAAE
jgi:hypothetical protein